MDPGVNVESEWHGPRHQADAAFLIVEDDEFASRTFVALVELHAQAESVGTIAEAVGALGRIDWAGLVLDVNLPDGSGVELLEQLRQTHRTLPVLVVMGSGDETVANRAHRLRASCVFKPDVFDDVAFFVERAIAARADVRTKTLAALQALATQLQLTKREAEIAELITFGVAREEIASQLGVSENTAKTMVRHLLSKFRKDNVEGVARAVLEEVVRATAFGAM